MPNGDSSTPKYHVAISFLAADEPTAKALFDLLDESGLRVFFFPRAQEELAGTNGMESMRTPFSEALVNVVLFKAPWGETPWTRVESTAIQERCLNDGWNTLFFVQMDRISKLPNWLPPMHVRFALENYPIDQLAGAIKMRVQEQGGTFSAFDAMAMLKRVQAEANYLADRSEMMSSRAWIERVVHQSLREAFQEVDRLVAQASSQGFQMQSGATGYKECVIRSGYLSLGISWRQPIFNQVGDFGRDECYLRVTEVSGALPLPSERSQMWFHEPKTVKEHRFKVDVSLDRSLVWVAGKQGQIPAKQLADRLMKIFLDLISRANQGKIERPSM